MKCTIHPNIIRPNLLTNFPRYSGVELRFRTTKKTLVFYLFLAINVLVKIHWVIKKLRDIIFLWGTITLCNLGVKKVEAPSKCPEKWLKKLLSHEKKLCPKVS